MTNFFDIDVVFLFKEFKKDLALKKIKKGTILTTNNLVIFESGIAYLYKDCNSVLIQVTGPMIIGLDKIYDNSDISVCFAQDTDFSFIKKNNLLKKLNSDMEYWVLVCDFLIKQVNILYEKESLLSNKTKYESVKKHLEIIGKMEEIDRMNISVFKYIMTNMNISRSLLYKIINELNKGGFIKTKRGRLVSLKKLPDAF